MKNSKANQKTKIIFIIDSIRIGGVERLCFDECYELIDRKIDHEILCLTNNIIPEETILNIDKNYSKINDIKLTFLGKTRILQIISLVQILTKNKEKQIKIVSHSTRGSVIARISTVISCRKIPIMLFIHQTINFSNRKQRNKRMFHSLFAHTLAASSFQFKLDWEEHVNKNILYKLFYPKKIEFNRMGVYLPRLKDSVKNEILGCSGTNLHLLFMSRITVWKGFEIFNNVCKLMEPSGNHSVVISNENSRKNIFSIDNFQNYKNHYIPNSGIANINFTSDVIHLYPTNYGPKIRHPQSIGMNVIECLAVGIPSLISFDEFITWPEFRTSPLIKIVNWKNEEEVVDNIQQMIALGRKKILEKSFDLKNIISIKKHVDIILSY